MKRLCLLLVALLVPSLVAAQPIPEMHSTDVRAGPVDNVFTIGQSVSTNTTAPQQLPVFALRSMLA